MGRYWVGTAWSPSISPPSISPPSTPHSMFIANNGSALLLQLSLAYLEGDLLFENNTANLGAAISVQDRSRVRNHISYIVTEWYSWTASTRLTLIIVS